MRDRGICHVCHRPLADQVDHVIPLSEDGPDTLDNLAAIHAQPCHEAKTQAEAQRAERHRTRERKHEPERDRKRANTNGGGG